MRAMLAQRTDARRARAVRNGHGQPCGASPGPVSRRTCQTPGHNRTCVRFEGPVTKPGRLGWKGRDPRMLSRRQRIWDEAIRDLGIDPAWHREGRGPRRRHRPAGGASRATSRAQGMIVRGRRGVGLGGVRGPRARAPSTTPSSTCSGRPAPSTSATTRSGVFARRSSRRGPPRATHPAAIPAEFAARLLRRLSGVYERLRMPDRAAEAAARAAVIAELSPDGRRLPPGAAPERSSPRRARPSARRA